MRPDILMNELKAALIIFFSTLDEKQVEVENKLKKIPNVIKKIGELMKYETASDPMSSLKWTRKTTQK